MCADPLLYGALHMCNLRAKLQAKFKLDGVSPPMWQTAPRVILAVPSCASFSSPESWNCTSAYGGPFDPADGRDSAR